MSSKPLARVVRWPTEEESRIAFEAYTLAVGKVAYASNFLQERLGKLFVVVAGCDRNIALAIWYSTDSDRVQRGMLRAAIIASPEKRWLPRLPEAKESLLWLLTRTTEFANKRNDAIHAPCSLVIDSKRTEMAAAYFTSHQRANNLRGKQLLVEFDWCERFAEALSEFSGKVETALAFEHYPWPDKPTFQIGCREKAFKGRAAQLIPYRGLARLKSFPA